MPPSSGKNSSNSYGHILEKNYGTSSVDAFSRETTSFRTIRENLKIDLLALFPYERREREKKDKEKKTSLRFPPAPWTGIVLSMSKRFFLIKNWSFDRIGKKHNKLLNNYLQLMTRSLEHFTLFTSFDAGIGHGKAQSRLHRTSSQSFPLIPLVLPAKPIGKKSHIPPSEIVVQYLPLGGRRGNSARFAEWFGAPLRELHSSREGVRTKRSP